MFPGYAGKILWVDLTVNKVTIEHLNKNIVRKYIGGTGLATRILYDQTSVETDPLGPDNPLIFMTGPFTGTKVPLSGRHHVVSRSPLTGIFGESDVGGRWGTELKKSGFDGVVVRGSAKKPTYIWINGANVELSSADHLWGLDTYDVDPILKRETDNNAAVTSIGQAGERLALISSIMSEGKDGRAAGRCGLGAVMGSKKLKAIVVKGDMDISVADPQDLFNSIKEYGPLYVKQAKYLRDYGTSGGITTIAYLGDLSVKNWTEGITPDEVENLSGKKMAESILSSRYYCFSCLIGCGRVVTNTTGKYSPVDGGGPEYESVALLGANVLVDNLKAVSKANELCNRYGLDVISTGAVIGFALEAYDRGLLKPEDCGEDKLQWGDPDLIVSLIHKIGQRKGLGMLLGNGVKRVAEKLGGSASEFALHVKGLELPAHDPRAHNSLALGYATSSRGACHNQASSHIFERMAILPELGYPDVQDRFGVEGKGLLVAKLQDYMAMFDSLKVCKFLTVGNVQPSQIIRWIKSVTGWNFTLNEFMITGERISNLKRLYNIRLGLRRKDDILPQRIMKERKQDGSAKNLPPLNTMLSEYYECRRWNEYGVPSPGKIRELGLEQE